MATVNKIGKDGHVQTDISQVDIGTRLLVAMNWKYSSGCYLAVGVVTRRSASNFWIKFGDAKESTKVEQNGSRMWILPSEGLSIH